jgi:hypothetical protein
MLNFIVPWDQRWIFQNLKNRLPAENSSLIQFVNYHDLIRQKTIQEGIYVFTGYGVLTRVQSEICNEFCNHIDRTGSEYVVMNHPDRVLQRYDLLKALHLNGINQFRAFRIQEIFNNNARPDFPVFIREAGRHSGSLTGILEDYDSMSNSISKLKKAGFKEEHLLVVEYVDTSDTNGLYRKYSAFRLGDTIIPRYLSLSYHWVVKENATNSAGTVLYSEEMIQEELTYIEKNPDQQILNKIFTIANIEYGRIDYGFKDGNLQVWEINTLPVIGSLRGVSTPAKNLSADIAERKRKRATAKDHFYNSLDQAVSNLNLEKPTAFIPLTIPKELKRKAIREKTKHRITEVLLNTGRSLPSLSFMQSMRTAVKRSLKKLIHQ